MKIEGGRPSVDAVKILETMMLVCFGAAWPLSILKSWRARTAKGKSIGFLSVILLGYVAGLSKVVLSEGLGGFLLIPYSINFILVGTDVLLYFRNSALDRRAENEARANREGTAWTDAPKANDAS